MTTPYGYDYVRARPTGAIDYDNFNGDVTFVVNANESERWISPKNSYLSIRLRIVQTNSAGVCGLLRPVVNEGTSEAAATQVSIPFINPNPAACLFQAVNFDIGDENLTNTQNLASCNTLYRTLYESRNEQETVNSTNPIKLMGTLDTDVTLNKTIKFADYFDTEFGSTGAGCPVSNHQLFALKNMMEFNKYNEIEINTQCFAPIMYSDNLIPPNTPFTLRLNVDSSYHLNLLNLAGSTDCSLPAVNAVDLTFGKLSSATSNSGIKNNISVAILDMNLWLYRCHMDDAVSIPREIYINNFTSTIKPITGTTSEFNVDFKKNRRLTHIACAFIHPKNVVKFTPTDFSSGFEMSTTTENYITDNSPIFQINNLRIEYAGTVYPFIPYDLNFDFKAEIDTTKNSKGTFRCVYDYFNFSDSLRDRSGSMHNANSYIVSPIIMFKTFQNPNNDDNTCICSVNTKNQLTNCNMLVMAFYDENVALSYDQYGKYAGFKLF